MFSWDNAHLKKAAHHRGVASPLFPMRHSQMRCPRPSRFSQHQVDLALKLPVGVLDGKPVQKHPLSREALLDRLVCALLERGDHRALRASTPGQQHPLAVAQGAQREGTDGTPWLSVSHGALKGNSPKPCSAVSCHGLNSF